MGKPVRATYFKIRLEDRPGALLAVAKDLKSQNLGLVGLWGYATHSGEAELYLIAKNPDKVRNAWKPSGKIVEEGTGFLLKGTDKTGALIKSLETIANAGINIVAMNGIAVGGKYGSFVWVAPSDVEKCAQALGSK